MLAADIVIGLEGGGTYTRAVCADGGGQVLSYSQTGGANPGHNADAAEHVQAAIRQVVDQAGRSLRDVVGLVAGLAGLNTQDDHAWADAFTALPGLTCPRLQVNDAVIAHRGAFRAQPGIIAIAGTGTMVFGITEGGRHVRNFDFNQYARAAARHLAYEAVFGVLAGETRAADADFVRQILTFWQVDDIRALRECAIGNALADQRIVNRAYSAMATLVTAAAWQQAPLACAVCDAAVQQLCRGIRLVGNVFVADPVPLALVGSVVRSPYMRQQLHVTLAEQTEKRYAVVEPALTPAAGAALMALERQGVELDEVLVQTIGRHPRAVFHEGTPAA